VIKVVSTGSIMVGGLLVKNTMVQMSIDWYC
jgi:hypothetical protein